MSIQAISTKKQASQAVERIRKGLGSVEQDTARLLYAAISNPNAYAGFAANTLNALNNSTESLKIAPDFIARMKRLCRDWLPNELIEADTGIFTLGGFRKGFSRPDSPMPTIETILTYGKKPELTQEEKAEKDKTRQANKAQKEKEHSDLVAKAAKADNADKQAETLKAKIKSLQDELKKVRSNGMEKLENQLVDTQKEVEDLKSQLGIAKQTNLQLESKNQELAQQLAVANSAIAKNQEYLTMAIQERDNLKGQLIAARQETKAAQSLALAA